MDIALPDSLTCFEKSKRKLPRKSALLFLEDDFGNPSLYVFRSKLRFEQDYMCTAKNRKSRMQNLGWWIREYYKRGGGLWDSFSEELVMDKIRDKQSNLYEIHCSQAFSVLSRGIPSCAYVLNTRNESGVKEAFVFGANELLKKVSSAGFEDSQVKKLADFLYEDFTTMKYSNKSREVGQDADSVFFPA